MTLSQRRRQARQIATGTLLWQRQLAAIDDFPLRHFTKSVVGFGEKLGLPGFMFAVSEIVRHASPPHGTDKQALCLRTPHSSVSPSPSPEKADSAFQSSPGGGKLHFLLAYKTKQDKEVICSSSLIFWSLSLSLSFGSHLALSVRKTQTNCAFFFKPHIKTLNRGHWV